jgi:hypothetical protein
VVLDSVAASESEARFDLLWHYPAGSSVEPAVAGRSATAHIGVEDDRFVVHVLATADLTVEVVEGRLEPTPQGWVTDAPGVKRPAPVLVVSAGGREFLGVTVVTRPGVAVRTRQAGKSIEVWLGDRRLELSGGHQPIVELAPGAVS